MKDKTEATQFKESTTASATPTQPDHGEEQHEQEREQLKQLLLHEERDRVTKLERSLGEPAEHTLLLRRDLPRAIRESGAEDHKLSKALAPTVEDILHDSVRRSPRSLADALYPVMGPSIRRSIAEALRGMVESFNEVLSHSFTWQGLKWRLEALRTRKTFAEVVLLNSLVFRVEQLFLIHKETGLVLQHISAEAVEHQDADMVSGMLTAIQDFVRDSFANGASSDEGLDFLQMGDLHVLIEQGPEAVLALVVRGRPPADLKSIAIEALETIQLEKQQDLRNFQGDSSVFEAVRPLLEDCMQARYQPTTKKKPFAAMIGAGVILLLIIAASWYFYHLREIERNRWNVFLADLNTTPGIMVAESGERDGRRFVRGLRDPAAPHPEELLEVAVLEDKDIILDFEPYQSMLPEFLLRNANRALTPPQGVQLSYEDGVLRATGEAPSDWVLDARKIARALPGVIRYDDQNISLDHARDIARFRTALNAPDSVELDFSKGRLTAKGRAPTAWITAARNTARALPGVREFHDEGVVPDYSSELAWFTQALSPPKSVTLDFKDGTLTAAGAAPYPWIQEAQKAAIRLPGVKRFNDEGVSIDYADTLRRFRSALPDLESVSMELKHGVLTVKGRANHAWVARARRMAANLPELKKYDDSGLLDIEQNEFDALHEKVENAKIEFKLDKSAFASGQEKKIKQLADQVMRMQELSTVLQNQFALVIYGHTDQTGSAEYNRKLSEARAAAMKKKLGLAGVNPAVMIIDGVGSSVLLTKGDEEEDRRRNRRVELTVRTIPQKTITLD